MSPRRDLPHVFEPFFNDEAGRGPVLGLAIARKVVEALGGTNPDARAVEGEGARVEIELPDRPIRRTAAEPRNSFST